MNLDDYFNFKNKRQINSIVKDESNESAEDPALKSLSLVFKSLVNSSSFSSPNEAKASTSNDSAKFPMEIISMLQGISPFVLPSDALSQEELSAHLGLKADQAKKPNEEKKDMFSPFNILKLLEPHINESLVKEIQTVYEFHITSNESEKVDVFFLDLKHLPKGQMGIGPSMFSKVDCVIKLSGDDLKELLTDRLKPFTAYMSGRIEIQGDLQDVFKLKRLIKNVTSTLNLKKI